jgi:hypothetical protein
MEATQKAREQDGSEIVEALRMIAKNESVDRSCEESEAW